MKLLIHCGRIRPSCRVEVHFALPGHIEEVDDENIERKLTVAITLCHRQQLILCGVDCLALDVAIGRFGQQVGDAGELPIALVDFVGVCAGDDEERDTVSYLRRPDVLLVESEINGGL